MAGLLASAPAIAAARDEAKQLHATRRRTPGPARARRAPQRKPIPRPGLEGADTSALETFTALVAQASSPAQELWLVATEYPRAVHRFRRANWEQLGIEPAPAPGDTVEDALDDGWFIQHLRDGTRGYFMRRSDDCSTATVATLAQCHPSLVPDPHEMRRILSGTDPATVLAELDGSYETFAGQTGVRLRLHSSPPVWAKRWIGAIERDANDPLANHLLVCTGRDLLFDPAHPSPAEDDRQTALEGYTVADVTYGWTLE